MDSKATKNEASVTAIKPRIVIWTHAAKISTISFDVDVDILVIDTDVEYVNVEDQRRIGNSDVVAGMFDAPPSPEAVNKTFAEFEADVKVEVE